MITRSAVKEDHQDLDLIRKKVQLLNIGVNDIRWLIARLDFYMIEYEILLDR